MKSESFNIEERVKALLKQKFPFLSDEEIQESWQEFYITQIKVDELKEDDTTDGEKSDEA